MVRGRFTVPMGSLVEKNVSFILSLACNVNEVLLRKRDANVLLKFGIAPRGKGRVM
jgi:hypothetical protein